VFNEFLTKCRNAWGGFFTGGTMQDIDQSRSLQSAVAVSLSCRYWRFNDPFCCIHRSRESQCFSIGLTIPKIALSVGDHDSHVIIGSSDPHESASQTASWSVQPFLQGCTNVTNRHTDTHTDRPRYPVSSNSPHLMQCTRCDLIIIITNLPAIVGSVTWNLRVAGTCCRHITIELNYQKQLGLNIYRPL